VEDLDAVGDEIDITQLVVELRERDTCDFAVSVFGNLGELMLQSHRHAADFILIGALVPNLIDGGFGVREDSHDVRIASILDLTNMDDP